MQFVAFVLALSLATTPGAWSKPVDGAVVRAFQAPLGHYGPGHRGVDFAATPGSSVRAAGAGTVTFAGSVAGARHVVVAHAGDLRTSYSYLATTSVRRGDAIARGDVVGTAGGTGDKHGGGVVHFGLRQGETYVDPMVLFEAVDLTEVVHLAPVSEPFFRTEADERRGLLSAIGGIAGDAFGAFAGAGDAAVDAVHALGAPLYDLLENVSKAALPQILELVEWQFPLVRNAKLALGVLRSAYRYGQELMNCDHNAPSADGTGGSGHRVMLVGGIASHVDTAGERANGLDAAALGYEADEITTFSYSGDPTYDRADTFAPIIESAYRLGEQLRAMQRAEPGREVDLIAHSQGGVVVVAFLELVYEPGDPEYPPLGTVVTFASPLDGAPLATLAAELRNGGGIGQGLLALYDGTGAGPPSDAAATVDLAAGSELMQQLAQAERPGTVDLTTIGGAHDLVVPGNTATTAGARHTIVVPDGFNAHSGILSDADALRAARAALEARAELPCRDPLEFAAAEVFPGYVEHVETSLDDLVARYDEVNLYGLNAP